MESFQVVNRNGTLIVRVVDSRPVVPLVGIGDLHLGSKNCDLDLVKKVIKWTKEHDAWWIGMGDWLEHATRHSVGSGVYDQTLTINQQIELATSLFQPIADRCLGLLKGNHEERGVKGDGNDTMSTIANDLRTKNTASGRVPYLGWFSAFVITGGMRSKETRCSYSGVAFHSYSGNKNAGLAFAWVDREVRSFIEGVDLIFKAHDHNRGMSPPDEGLSFSKSNLGFAPCKRYTLLTGHFLEWGGSYAAAKPMKPKPKGTVVGMLHMSREPYVTPLYLPEEI